MPTIDTSQVNVQSLESGFDSAVISGLGFSVGSVLFGLAILWLGGTKLKEQIRKFRI